jgi:rubrerythrin
MSPVEKAVLDNLTKGIQAEIAAYVFYKKSMEIIKDNKLKNILARLAAEEKDHYRILEGQYDSLVRSEMWVTYNYVLFKEGLPDIDEKIEEVHNELIDKITESSTPMEILKTALFLEERACDLYTELASKTDDLKGKETYEYLAKFENGHVIKIKKMMGEFV